MPAVGKTISRVLIAVAVSAFLAACGGADNQSALQNETSPEEVTSPAEVGSPEEAAEDASGAEAFCQAQAELAEAESELFDELTTPGADTQKLHKAFVAKNDALLQRVVDSAPPEISTGVNDYISAYRYYAKNGFGTGTPEEAEVKAKADAGVAAIREYLPNC